MPPLWLKTATGGWTRQPSSGSRHPVLLAFECAQHMRIPRPSEETIRRKALPTQRVIIMSPLPSEEGTTEMGLRTFTLKPRPESGLEAKAKICLVCRMSAMFARQRKPANRTSVRRPTHTGLRRDSRWLCLQESVSISGGTTLCRNNPTVGHSQRLRVYPRMGYCIGCEGA